MCRVNACDELFSAAFVAVSTVNPHSSGGGAYTTDFNFPVTRLIHHCLHKERECVASSFHHAAEYCSVTGQSHAVDTFVVGDSFRPQVNTERRLEASVTVCW